MSGTRRRSIQVHLRLDEAEHRHLRREAAKSGLALNTFLRHLIMGVQLQPRPPDAYMDLLREMKAIGVNINQIARKANGDNRLDPKDLEAVMRMQAALWQRVKGL